MEIKQLEPKDKVITFFGEFKSSTVERAIKDLTNIMFQLAIDQYEKKHAVVVPRTELTARKTIF